MRKTKAGLRIIVSLIVLFLLWNVSSTFAFAKKPAPAVKTQPQSVKKYACPMKCALSEKPGKCPKCGMEMWEVSK